MILFVISFVCIYKTCAESTVMSHMNITKWPWRLINFFKPEGGFGVENVFLFLWAGTLLDLLFADLLPDDLSASSSPAPENISIIDLWNLNKNIVCLWKPLPPSDRTFHKMALYKAFNLLAH